MTPDQLLTAVLTDQSFVPNEDGTERWHKGSYTLLPNSLLTSRDAVWEVLGLKDLPGEYWNIVESVVNLKTVSDDKWIRSDMATPPQLLEAWLEWKKQEKGK